MQSPHRRSHGYSLIELLVVLVILGVLAGVGVFMIGARPNAAVRGVMDELEGVLAGAQSLAGTGRDVMIATRGDWTVANPMILAYGDAADGSATILTKGLTASSSFRLGVVGASLKREHLTGGVVTNATAGWFATAGTGSPKDITAVPPFNDPTTGFQGILDTATNLFQGGGAPGVATNTVLVSGTNQRFTTTFWVEVVGLEGDGPVAGGPMGLLVVLANGATIYKFYNPGIRNGNGTWRKI